tara:strand:- start:7451 stop:8011 length:561 start_codon:yes stop_codon:yes gene_type:complete
MISLNVILTTIGRNGLIKMFESLINQLQKQDYLTVISDDAHPFVRSLLSEFNFKCTVIHIANSEPLGYWGHGSRNKYQNLLPGDYLANADDDDRYVENCFEKIREVVKEDKLYIFKHKHYDNYAWSIEGRVELGNIGTSCGVISNTHDLPDWELVYGGDASFYIALAKQKECEWVDHLIYKVRDTE